MAPTDAALATALAAGDANALAGIYDRYADTLHNFCFGVCRNADQAADATQQTFLLAFERVGQLRDPAKLRSWLFSIARNEVMKGFRQTARTRPAEDEVLETATAADVVETPLETAELQDLVWEAAEGLDERDRVLLELNVRGGLEGGELADAIGVDRDHGYVLAKRMRERVEKSLGALLVARQARTACPDLDRLLADWDGRFSVLVRKRVGRHLTQCDDCEERRRRLVSPVALYGAAPVLAAPIGLRQAVLDGAGSFVGTAEAAEYDWNADGFPEPLEPDFFDDPEPDTGTADDTTPPDGTAPPGDRPPRRGRSGGSGGGRPRGSTLRRMALLAAVSAAVVAVGVVASQGGDQQPDLVAAPATTTEAPPQTVPTTTVPATPTTEAPTPTTTTTTTPTLPPQPPPAPTLTEVDPSGTAIWIRWDPPTPYPPGTFEVGLTTNGGDPVVTDVGVPNNLIHQFPDLSCNQTYGVGVRFVDDNGLASSWAFQGGVVLC